MKNKIPQVLIPMGGLGKRLHFISKGLAKGLIKIQGKPVMLYLITKFVQQGVSDFIIVSRTRSIEYIKNILLNSFNIPNINVIYKVHDAPRGLSHAIGLCENAIDKSKPLLIALSDTLFNEVLPFEDDWVGTSKPNTFGKWCWVEVDRNNFIVKFYDKTLPPQYVTDVVVGLYYITNPERFLDCVNNLLYNGVPIAGEYQISQALERYMKSHPLRAYKITTWTDCGDLESYTEANKLFLKKRFFNNIKIENNGIVVKSSSSRYLANEINWFKKIPSISLKLVPSIFHVNPDNNMYKIELIDLPLLGEIYLYEYISLDDWTKIFSELLNTLKLNLWNSLSAITIKHEDLVNDCKLMYINKTFNRLKKWDKFHKFKNLEILVINGNSLLGPLKILKTLEKALLWSSESPLPGVVHGDLNFSNIFFSPTYRFFKVIDPRGKFGKHVGVYGDIYYDLAKLRHSYAGMYDAIINDLFIIKKINVNEFMFYLGPNRESHKEKFDAILRDSKYDLLKIKIIESSLFFSMISLHNDAPLRQLAFLFTAIRSVNEWIKDFEEIEGQRYEHRKVTE